MRFPRLLFRDVLFDRLGNLGSRGLHADPLDVTGLDVCTGQRVLEERAAWVGHQKIIICFNVFWHEPPEGHLVVVVDPARPRVFHVIYGRARRDLVEGHRVHVVITYVDAADDWQSLEAVYGRVALLGGSDLAFQVINRDLSNSRYEFLINLHILLVSKNIQGRVRSRGGKRSQLCLKAQNFWVGLDNCTGSINCCTSRNIYFFHYIVIRYS